MIESLLNESLGLNSNFPSSALFNSFISYIYNTVIGLSYWLISLT